MLRCSEHTYYILPGALAQLKFEAMLLSCILLSLGLSDKIKKGSVDDDDYPLLKRKQQSMAAEEEDEMAAASVVDRNETGSRAVAAKWTSDAGARIRCVRSGTTWRSCAEPRAGTGEPVAQQTSAAISMPVPTAVRHGRARC